MGNSIFKNDLTGIDLNADGPNPNDPLDADEGPNRLQNFPVITNVTLGSSVNIEGMLDSAPNTDYRIEFFANFDGSAACRGEGELFIGSKDVTTDERGATDFSATFSVDVEGRTLISWHGNRPQR